MINTEIYSSDCQQCPRIADNLERLRTLHPSYHNKPVAPFGEHDPDLLIVGLGPGLHGANATGRPFTGDYAGVLLYETLFESGFSNQAVATRADDGLKLFNCRITNAVKCLPPDNKPTTSEVNLCNNFLRNELTQLKKGAVIIALGTVAHRAILRALDLKQSDYAFGHGAEHPLENDRYLIDSYHCSRYNTQTRRLNAEMFQQIFSQAKARLVEHPANG